jgi:CPA2 family monovalent cation:H+ antiporter-2
MLREANLETLNISANSAAAGKFIRELALRTSTGASIVGIQRNGERIINPGPDEELHPGDEILLLGTRAQLAAARTALA